MKSKRDFWIYQDREVSEPWAVHVWIFPGVNGESFMDIRIYAEYLDKYERTFTNLTVDFENIVEKVISITAMAPPDVQFTNEDYEHIKHVFEICMKND